MVKKLNNCLLLFVVLFLSTSGINHPIFMSVTEIEHNTKDKTLEISCKMFTNDLENQLKITTKQKIDLLNASLKTKMNGIVEDYIQSHLKIAINDNLSSKMKFIGFEQNEDAIVSYFEIEGVTSVNKVKVENNLLYEYSEQQINLIHVIVKGNRKSYKLDNPDTKAEFVF